MKTTPRPILVITFVCLIIALAGCASTEKRYRKGQRLESEGRLDEAAERYIAVLAKEPGRTDARERLADVGGKLVRDLLAQARDHEAAGRYDSAVTAILGLDGLRDRTAQVGVPLEVPPDYAGFRRDTVDAGLDSLFRQGADLESQGNWAEAAKRYDRLLAYPLDTDDRLRVDDVRARALVRWAGQDLERGSFRAAYGHAQSALEIYGPDGERGAESRSIQKAALDAGTRSVAVLPFWADPGAGDRAPRGIESKLYDTLLYEHLEAPVLFVGPLDRGAIHREMTRLRVRSGEIPLQTAAVGGQALNADFVVVGWLESYLEEEGVPSETERKVPLRRDKSRYATYTERKFSIKLTGEVMYRIVEPASRRIVEEEAVAATATAQFRRGYYDGDTTALDLSRDERMLFDKEEWLRAEEELQKDLIDKLADKIAASVFERVLRYVK